MNLDSAKNLTYKYSMVILSSLVMGYLTIQNGKMIVAALLFSLLFLFLMKKLRTPTLYTLFFISVIWWPIWMNSYSLLGIRFGFLTINYPLLFLGIFMAKSFFNLYQKKVPFRIDLVDWILLFSVIWVLISALTKSIAPESKSNFFLLGFPILYYFTAKFTDIQKKDVLSWMKYIVYFSTLTVPYLIYELITKVNIFLPPTDIYENFVYNYTLEAHGVFQPSGPFIDPNTAGLFLPFAVAMSLYFYNTADSNKQRLKWAFFIVAISAGVLITLSRTSYVCLLLVYFVNFLFIVKNKIKYVAGLAALLILSACYLNFAGLPPQLQERLNDSETLATRVGFYQDFAILLKNNWVTGMGFDNFRRRDRITPDSGPAHNIFVTILIELGVVGCVVFFAPIGFIYLSYRKYTQLPSIDKPLLATFLIFFLNYYVGGLTMNPHLYVQLNGILYIFMSVFMNHTNVISNNSLPSITDSETQFNLLPGTHDQRGALPA